MEAGFVFSMTRAGGYYTRIEITHPHKYQTSNLRNRIQFCHRYDIEMMPPSKTQPGGEVSDKKNPKQTTKTGKSQNVLLAITLNFRIINFY